MKTAWSENRMTVSVRELVEWVVREGDIDSRSGAVRTEDAMLLGAEAHRKLQKAAGAFYRAEVPFQTEKELFRNEAGPFLLTVEGRADGVIETTDEDGNAKLVIDEIKGVFRDVNALEGPEAVHLAQAECYASMLSEEQGNVPVSVQMTYVELRREDTAFTFFRNGEIRRFTFDYTAEEIREKFEGYLRAYESWVRFQSEHEKARRESAGKLDFPYEYRPGQKKIVRQVYETVTEGKRLFVQAPTGIGKTLAMLYPSIRSAGDGLGDKIFYLTAKTVAGKAAEEAMRLLAEKGLAFSSIQITAKEKLCPLDAPECDPVHCDRAKGHFSRVNEAIYDLITNETLISTGTILSYAEKHQVCPYEFALDVSLFTDVIICDYNYVFDPHVYFRRYFAGGATDSILLIDEAHNLVERAREMYSAVLVKEHVLEAKKLFPNEKTVRKHLDKVNRLLLAEKRETEDLVLLPPESVEYLYQECLLLKDAIRRYYDRQPSDPNRKESLDFFFEVSDFLSVYESLDEGYLVYKGHTEGGDFFIKLFAVDPANRLKERLSEVRSTVFFSATFLPIQYYKELLAGNPDEEAMYVDSPFDPAKRALLIVRDVSSKYTRRNREEYEKIARHLLRMTEGAPGNYLAFFPSHKYLEDVAEVLSGLLPDRVELMKQERVMSDEARKAFLSRFTEEPVDSKGTLLGLSVMGGLFSEAIDLTGDALIGVAVVGTGLPQVSKERELIRAYFDRAGKNGFDYAYRFPGFTKVLQAAGRLIRTYDDAGVILLMDERFLYRENRALFPREWSDARTADSNTLSGEIRNFWNRR